MSWIWNFLAYNIIPSHPENHYPEVPLQVLASNEVLSSDNGETSSEQEEGEAEM